MLDVIIRPERNSDATAVHAVVAAAFERDDEAKLVDALRRVADPYIAFVAEAEGRVIGHVAFTPITVDGDGPAAMGLAPVAVEPNTQNRGVGSALVRAGLKECAARDVGLVFVLGHSEYYPRFGFRPAFDLGFHYRSTELDPSFFVLELSPRAAAGRSGYVRYHPAFDERF
jgi:putative acetyltransferase